MSLKGIISISGMPGLFKVLAQTKSGFIVESLADKKRMPVSSAQKISMLEDISVFTNTDDLPLTDVMLKLKDFSSQNEIADAKTDPSKLRDFFKKVIPDFDNERVYPSDIKKIITWFHMVKDIVDIPDETEKTEDTKAADEETAPVTETEAPAKKKRVAKADKKSESDTVTDEAPKPASKPRKKKEPGN